MISPMTRPEHALMEQIAEYSREQVALMLEGVRMFIVRHPA
jgi:hypothetical protein